MDYNADRIFQEVASLASKGWKIVRLWGVRDNFTCTCGRPDCATPGKHPHGGAGWPDRATDSEDEIWSWFENVEEHTRCNVGVRLGPSSGIIDVEFDSPEAEAVLKRFGLHQIDTPTYKAGRGEHRIFQCENGLPDAGVVKVEGLEVRLGGGDSASQSVIPPSWHKSGVQYQWLPGKSPADVNPAPLPEAFRQAILDSSRKRGSGVVSQALEALRSEQKVTEGGRHAFLVGIASRFASLFRNFSEADQRDLARILWGVNLDSCDPPKGRDEVIKIAKDQFQHYQQRQIERRNRRPFEKYGLFWNAEESRWEPGEWRLTIVESDPPEYKLRIPAVNGERRRHLTVRLDAKQITSARDVAISILEVTKSMDMLDPNPARWTKIWDGENIRDEDGGWRSVRGLKCQLFDEADREIPPPEANVSTSNASILYQYLRFGFTKSEDGSGEADKLPNHSGIPKWIQDEKTGEWGLWLKWNETMDAAWRKKGRQEPSTKEKRLLKAQILEEVGEENFESTAKKFDRGSGRWFLLRDRHIDALEKLSGSI